MSAFDALHRSIPARQVDFVTMKALVTVLVLLGIACGPRPVRTEVQKVRYERKPEKAEAKEAKMNSHTGEGWTVFAQAMAAANKSMAEGSHSQSSSARSHAGLGSTALLLYADNHERTFLGCINCSEYDANSVWNRYGSYGSEYSSTSIRNGYSQYGSEYSSISACNEYASKPPLILDNDGDYYGRFTVNEYAQDANDDDAIRKLVRLLCIR